MEEIADRSQSLEKLSDIELVVIVAKQIDQCIDAHFLPSEHPKRAMLGRKLSMSTLDKRLKHIISKNILYQRNDLVHTPEVNTFSSPEARKTFIRLSEEVFRELERLSQGESEVETDSSGDIGSLSAKSLPSLSTLESLSEELIRCSPSLGEIIADDEEKLLCDV